MHFFTWTTTGTHFSVAWKSIWPSTNKMIPPQPIQHAPRLKPRELHPSAASATALKPHAVRDPTQATTEGQRRSRQRKMAIVLLKSRNQQQLSPLQRALNPITQSLQLTHLHLQSMQPAAVSLLHYTLTSYPQLLLLNLDIKK